VKKNALIIAVVLGAVTSSCLVLGGIAWYLHRGGETEPVTAHDRRTLLSATDMGITAQPGAEHVTKERRYNGVTVLTYELTGVGLHGAGHVKQWRFDHRTALDASTAFTAAKATGSAGFDLSSKNGEQMIDLPLPIELGDERYSAQYQHADGAPYGHFVLIRKGNQLYMLSSNGWIWKKLDDLSDRLERVASQLGD
jgi:hypothetical protein